MIELYNEINLRFKTDVISLYYYKFYLVRKYFSHESTCDKKNKIKTPRPIKNKIATLLIFSVIILYNSP